MSSRKFENDNDSAISSILSRQNSFALNTRFNDNSSDISGVSSNETGKRSKSSKSSLKNKRGSSGGANSVATNTNANKHPGGIMNSGNSTGRVKVGVRCRPPFQDEIDSNREPYFSIIETISPNMNPNTGYMDANTSEALACVSLSTPNGKARDFMYDFAFHQDATQDVVYDALARPVVSEVLAGFNGTIFAYGQTGTGKTYTMGILEFVDDEHAGIVPRAISQIFDYVASQPDSVGITITMSFLQIYRETIQDLLSPASPGNGHSTMEYNNPYKTKEHDYEDNLQIREDPHRGFYVENLQEYAVRSYAEAEALVNLGLENRAIAPTLMNATSSRSHTVLTINIEQRGMQPANNGKSGNSVQFKIDSYSAAARTVRSKLLMVDLAGSERVRRTVSKGTRLSEAKAINTSLSALGNVIAALADCSTGTKTHVPFRDSKLTRLLQDSLGGTASTALVATVGPAAVNYGETLSTLQFATRCMAIKTTPIQHEELNYAELCVRLQSRVSDLETELASKQTHCDLQLQEQQQSKLKEYECVIRDLNEQLEIEKSKYNSRNENQTPKRSGTSNVEHLMDYFQSQNPDLSVSAIPLFGQFIESNQTFNDENGVIDHIKTINKMNDANKNMIIMCSYIYELLLGLAFDTTHLLINNSQRDEKRTSELDETYNKLVSDEELIARERNALMKEDPFIITVMREHVNEDLPTHITKAGGHLSHLTHADALLRVEGKYRSNSDPISGLKEDESFEKITFDAQHENELTSALNSSAITLAYLERMQTNITEYDNPLDLLVSINDLHTILNHNIAKIGNLFIRKDEHFKYLKQELVTQLIERGSREEEVVNWSYILKYLLATTTKLRRELQHEKKLQAANHGHGKGYENEVQTLPIRNIPVVNADKAVSDIMNHISVVHSQKSMRDMVEEGMHQLETHSSAISVERDRSQPSHATIPDIQPVQTHRGFEDPIGAKDSYRVTSAPADAIAAPTANGPANPAITEFDPAEKPNYGLGAFFSNPLPDTETKDRPDMQPKNHHASAGENMLPPPAYGEDELSPLQKVQMRSEFDRQARDIYPSKYSHSHSNNIPTTSMRSHRVDDFPMEVYDRDEVMGTDEDYDQLGAISNHTPSDRQQPIHSNRVANNDEVTSGGVWGNNRDPRETGRNPLQSPTVPPVDHLQMTEPSPMSSITNFPNGAGPGYGFPQVTHQRNYQHQHEMNNLKNGRGGANGSAHNTQRLSQAPLNSKDNDEGEVDQMDQIGVNEAKQHDPSKSVQQIPSNPIQRRPSASSNVSAHSNRQYHESQSHRGAQPVQQGMSREDRAPTPSNQLAYQQQTGSGRPMHVESDHRSSQHPLGHGPGTGIGNPNGPGSQQHYQNPHYSQGTRGSGGPVRGGVHQSSGGVHQSSGRNTPSSVQSSHHQAKPSEFAQNVVKGLGIEDKQAKEAMSVVDRVSKITPEQLQLLDEATRKQILQVRSELGLDNTGNAGLKRQSSAPTLSTTRGRSSSNNSNGSHSVRGTRSAGSTPQPSRIRSGQHTRGRAVTPDSHAYMNRNATRKRSLSANSNRSVGSVRPEHPVRDSNVGVGGRRNNGNVNGGRGYETEYSQHPPQSSRQQRSQPLQNNNDYNNQLQRHQHQTPRQNQHQLPPHMHQPTHTYSSPPNMHSYPVSNNYSRPQEDVNNSVYYTPNNVNTNSSTYGYSHMNDNAVRYSNFSPDSDDGYSQLDAM